MSQDINGRLRAGGSEFVYLLRMDARELSGLLHAVRRLRRATLDFSEAPAGLAPFLGAGLGPVCDSLVAWVQATVVDRRAADAVIRFFGLDRIPENLGPIGATLRARPTRSDLLGGGLGLTGRQVEKLIDGAVADLAANPAGPGMEPTADPIRPVTDPFPETAGMASRLTVNQVVLWAWAQVPDGERTAPSALLFYEYEHGLRDNVAPPQSRTERLRWRRLAWSMLRVAHHRIRQTDAKSGGANQIMGPRRLATVATIEIPQARREEIDALMSLCADPAGHAQGGAIEPALSVVRSAVRSGRAEAPELLGLFSDALSRRRTRRGPSAVPARAEAKMLTLNVILAREQRDVSGIPAGETATHRFRRLLELPSVRHDRPAYIAIVIDYLRMLQELAELYDNLGRYPAAHRTLEHLRDQLDHLGDPDPDTQPDGWPQQILLTSAIINRHLAMTGRHDPRIWHDEAAAAADRSHELGIRHANTMPPGWAIASGTQRVAVTVDRLSRAGRHHPSRAQRLLADAHRQLADLDDQTRRITDLSERSTRSQLLGVELTRWRIALLQGDPDTIARAQAKAITTLGFWTLPGDLETIQHYQRAGARFGIQPDTVNVNALVSHLPDRAHLGGR